MLDRKYWGRHGEYGPFREQADGWPNRGEVIKKYRKLKKMSAKNATAMSRSINSLATASVLKDIHTQLRNSSYGTSKAVRDLGAALILPLI